MQKFFQFHSKLASFQLFSIEHVMTLAIIFVLSILLFVNRKTLQKNRKEKIYRLALAFLLLITDASQHIWLIVEYAWSIKRDLPLQISDLAVILAIVMLFTKSYKLFQFMYFAGIGSSIQALITPDLGKFSFPHFQYIEFFISHGGTLLASLYMLVAFSYKPKSRSLWITILIIDLYASCVYFINKILDSNYLYIMKKPENPSLLDYLGPWPVYLFSMELVTIFSFYILYWLFPKKMKSTI